LIPPDGAAHAAGGELEGDWWRFDLSRAQQRVVRLERVFEVDAWAKTVCIIHDIERGLGHLDVDPAFAAQAEGFAPRALERMLEVEAKAGVKTTYHLVGLLYEELAEPIRREGHALGFHSYRHEPSGAEAMAEYAKEGSPDLAQCRRLDSRLKGYRTPRSQIWPELTDANLVYQNFEWFASSAHSFGTEIPRLENGLVKIPVHDDDFALYKKRTPFPEWERRILDLVDSRDFVVFGLHDCYGPFWLDHYEQLLEKLKERAVLITLDEVAARVALGHARWFEGR
jgi:peptidoglycan/xylan/chitin deacetylase (PgdA/CDA1 family)